MNQVKFSQMKDGDKEDYELLIKFEDKFIEGTGERIIRVLKGLDASLGGYKVSRLEHSLQTASRALREKATDEMIVAALLHDIGDEIAPLNHSSKNFRKHSQRLYYSRRRNYYNQYIFICSTCT